MSTLLAIAALSSITPAFAIFSGFDISNATLQLPPSQTQLTLPTNSTPTFVVLAVGVQNYTCSITSSWSTAGAFAELFDVSGLVNDPSFLSLQIPAFNAWNATGSAISVSDMISMFGGAPSVLGQHYYISGPNGTIQPKWDFTSEAFPGDEQAFFLGAKEGDIPSPNGNATNIDWVSLRRIDGGLADEVYRVDTIGGQPPSAECEQWDSTLSVKFASKYWLFGGSFSTNSQNAQDPSSSGFAGQNMTTLLPPPDSSNSTDGSASPDASSAASPDATSSVAIAFPVPTPENIPADPSTSTSNSGYRRRMRRHARPLLTKF